MTTRDGAFAVGDVVRLNSDLAKVRREQEPSEHFGGWCDRMAFCLDQPGRVVEIPERSARVPEVLRISHGALGCWCWNVLAVEEVLRDVGLLPFEEAESGCGMAVTIGDQVRIAVGPEEAKRLQMSHGGWTDKMRYCCGKVGRVEAIDRSGDMKVLIPGFGQFIWNPGALRSPYAQSWEAALCERLAGPLEGLWLPAVLAALAALGGRLRPAELAEALHKLSRLGNGQALGDWALALDLEAWNLSESEWPDVRITPGRASEVAAGPRVSPMDLFQDWWVSLPTSERWSRSI